MIKIKKYILLIVSVISCNVLFSQTKMKNNNQLEKLSPKHFKEIIVFVLNKGDRATYCNMYNNNPHLKIDDLNLYLNPMNQQINFFAEKLSINEKDYNEIVIFDNKTYFHIKHIKNKIIIDDNSLILNKYLKKIDDEMLKNHKDYKNEKVLIFKK